jgi:penicillin-binding protein 1A
MQDNERKNNGFKRNDSNPNISSDPQKTRLVDISEFSGTASGKNTPNRKNRRGSRGKKVAKVTAKSSLFVLKKVLTYVLNIVLTVLLVGVITGAVVALAFVIYIKNYIDPEFNGLENLKFDSSLSTTLWYIDKNGNEVELTDDRLHGSENRLWADYNTIPKNLINAYVAVEDQRFFEHNGVDIKRTSSAIYNFFIPTSNSYGGGSTITQQLIKNVSGENETTIQRKVQEIFRAFNVEDRYTKEEILEMYLNTIYLSQNTNGVRAAAETYFGKELKDLNLTECAALAAIAKSPIKYDPIINPKYNLERRNLVLKLMLEQEKITQEEFNEAYDAPLAINRKENYEYSEKIHSYYIDTVFQDVEQALIDQKKAANKTTADQMIFSGGLKIITCLDPDVQAALEEVFTNESYWKAETGIKSQAAMCVVDTHTGNLLGVVGGRGEKKINLGFNRATQSKRQCGSSIKPLSVYTLAIDAGLITYAGPVDDVPTVQLEKDGKNILWPPNAGKTGYSGQVPLTYAVKKSLNTTAVALCNELGVERVFDNLKEKMGFTTIYKSITKNGKTYSDMQLSPLSLGSFTEGVTVREMTQAYNVLANGGKFKKARSFTEVRDSKGAVLVKNEDEESEVFKPSSTYIMTSLLFHVVKSGTGGTASGQLSLMKEFPDLEVAGKTGSTNDDKDHYFCGYTPDYVGCTWYGYDNNKTITQKGMAISLWDNVMKLIYRNNKAKGISYKQKFDVPVDIVKDVPYCFVSGKKPTNACNHDKKETTVFNDGVFTIDTVPQAECDKHVLVKYDDVNKGVSVGGCPEENLIDVGLRIIDNRIFNIGTLDTTYTYPPVQGGSGFNKTCPVHGYGSPDTHEGEESEGEEHDNDEVTNIGN